MDTHIVITIKLGGSDVLVAQEEGGCIRCYGVGGGVRKGEAVPERL